MILDNWMPWHRVSYDFRLMDINSLKGICVFSRESVIAVTCNVESMEYRRRQNPAIGYEEHPRAGRTDNVKAFFALVQRFLGNIFTLKDFKFAWQKLSREFCKWMSPDLLFYYWTVNERFRDFGQPLPSFNNNDDDDASSDEDPQEHPLRLHRLSLNSREDSSIFVAGRSFLPTRNQRTIRQRIFKPCAHLPQPRCT
ncbi:uncharacterized protein LOC125556792 [Nematostella vectensis]|uniref:uncharacterized protein LOC125556792 n=1 Tax=Nematostella vectensis TaxID=45351 RepID=UPI00207711E5|nr:uncharacterized protein LOC125556792 [Nematostella vectensis]